MIDGKKPAKLDLSLLTANQLKNNGNRHFRSSNFTEAIKNYSLAIAKEPSNSILYSNRALAYLHLNDFVKVQGDCRHALQLDGKNLKAYFYLGQANLALEKYDLAIDEFRKCYDLCWQKRPINYGNEIFSAICLAKSLKMQSKERQIQGNRLALKSYLVNLAQNCVTADGSSTVNVPQEHVNQIEQLFCQLENHPRKEVPEHFCSRISFEIMVDPVITPSGVSYDRKSLLDHLHKVGPFDPLTRESLMEDQLVSNLTLKNAIDAFLNENPWAYSF